MFTIWTNPELVSSALQKGIIGSGLPLSEWLAPGELAYIREDGTAIIF
jgi:hypothetical protein